MAFSSDVQQLLQDTANLTGDSVNELEAQIGLETGNGANYANGVYDPENSTLPAALSAQTPEAGAQAYAQTLQDFGAVNDANNPEAFEEALSTPDANGYYAQPEPNGTGGANYGAQIASMPELASQQTENAQCVNQTTGRFTIAQNGTCPAGSTLATTGQQLQTAAASVAPPSSGFSCMIPGTNSNPCAWLASNWENVSFVVVGILLIVVGVAGIAKGVNPVSIATNVLTSKGDKK